MFKKICPARPQLLGGAEHTKVREHDQVARTPLADFFNIP